MEKRDLIYEGKAKRIDRTDAPDLVVQCVELELGRHHGQILLGDEFCPDTCRPWDLETRKKLDQDRFRQDLGEVEEAHQEVYHRVCRAPA